MITVTIVTTATFAQKNIYMAAATVISEKDHIETQKEIIRSRRSAYRVLKNLNLGKTGEFSRSKDPIAALLKKLRVDLIKDTRILKIKVIDQNPRLASLIANEFAKVYVDSNIALKTKAADQANEWLKQEVGKQKRKVAESELRLQKYKEANNLISIEHQRDIINAEIIRLNAAYIDAQKIMIDAEIKGGTEAVYIAAKQEEEKIRSSLERQKKEAGNLERKIIDYNILKRDIDADNRMLEITLDRLKEMPIAGQIQAKNVRVQDIAAVPERPIRPRKRFNITLSVMLGLIGGTGLAFFREYKDITVKDPIDVSGLLQIPVLGFVPSIKTDGKNIKRKSDIYRIVEKDINSLAAEAYRSIRTNFLFLIDHSNFAKSIVITSSLPREGKTLTAVNLAMMMANSGERVLLVDAYMKKPGVHTIFNEKNEIGLSQFLLNKQDFENVVRRSDIDNLYFVTSGRVAAGPAGSISSRNMKLFIEKAAAQFSKIIFDTPPVGLSADAVALSAICTGVILITEGKKASKKVLGNSKELFRKVDARILGVIVNNITLTKDISLKEHHRRGGKS